MNWLLEKFVSRLVRKGKLLITDAAGKQHEFGDGSGDPVRIAIHTVAAERAVALDPTLAVPERYMDGEIDFAEGDLLRFLHLAYSNMDQAGTSLLSVKLADALRHSLRRLQQWNTAARAKRNVHRHYDLSEDLYRLFLDEDMQYSCAYFETPDVSLEEAQRAKKRHIMAKLALEREHKVLDIGCGWGGLGLDIARRFDANVLGITLSEEQHRVASGRARKQELSDRARFEIIDYRSLKGPFDRIVSVGMFEHVGINHYRTFFDQCARLLSDDGVMLLHTIGRSAVPAATNAFIRKYIFPGGYIPALSEVTPAIEKAGLIITDIEILRLHYAETLKHWQERFQKNRAKAVEIYDERFARMWEFYLAGSEASFRWQEMVVFQIQITKKRETLPVTRGYIDETERKLAQNAGKATRKFTQAAE